MTTFGNGAQGREPPLVGLRQAAVAPEAPGIRIPRIRHAPVRPPVLTYAEALFAILLFMALMLGG